ncbi:MAG: transcription antitermination factor NusB [Planctomycetes bacterium]|nr:transcription antitermination factor NusB [Planctomycetota bacterium]
MKHRHRARRLALQTLCCLDAQGEDAMDLAVTFIREGRESLDVMAIAERMAREAWAARDQADRLVAAHSPRWDVPRMPVVDRGILRLACWELAAGDAPPKVVLNEAIRLAQEFSTAESPRFINGVLDAIARDLAPQTPPTPQHP